MIEAVRELCSRILDDRGLEPLHAVARAEQRRLGRPLRVAVVGHVSSGKSTLVNALIGRRIGRTGEGEVTQVTASYLHARERGQEGACVKLAGVPEMQWYSLHDLAGIEGIDTEALNPVVAYVDHPLLERLTVIDTPGLFSANQRASERTRRLVTRHTEAAVQRADAILFLSSDLPGRDVDLEELDRFRRLFGRELRRAPTNSMFVLNEVDRRWLQQRAQSVFGQASSVMPPLELGNHLMRHDEDTWEELRARVWDARPLVGLLAETARCGDLIDERLVEDARRLAGHGDRDGLLRSRRDFLDADTEGVDRERKEVLHAGLDLYGLHVAMTAVEHGCRTPAQLGGQLLKESGIEEVQRLVDQLFRDRAELITADSVLSHLERTVLSDAQLGPLGRHRVRDLIEAVRSDDRATGLRRLKALRLALDKTIPLNGERRAELRPLLSCGQARERLGDDGSRALGELIREARARREWWQGLGNVMPSLPERRWLAGEVVHSYDEVLGELTHSH